MQDQNNACSCDDCSGCGDCGCRENWDPKHIGGWKGFIRQLYRHHKPSGGAFIMRLVLGILFAAAGWEKLTHLQATLTAFAGMGFNVFEIYLLVWVELVGGILLILGLLTKSTCVALAIPMIISIGVIPGSPSDIYFGHDYQFVLAAALVALYIGGPGKYSLAHLWLKRKKSASV